MRHRVRAVAVVVTALVPDARIGRVRGVLTLGRLATNGQGETFVVQAMVSNADAALAADSITDLVAFARRAFTLLG